MTFLTDLTGTLSTVWQLGLNGVKVRSNSGAVECRNSSNTARSNLQCNAIEVADQASSQINLGITRIVGATQVYTGTTGATQGYLDDFDGKWVYLTLNTIRSIGNASSGAAIAASWTATLFTHIWTQYTNTQAPLLDSSGSAVSRGASAAADYAANRRLTLPDYRGRVIAGAGTGLGLTARTQHTTTGEEAHTQTISEMPAHTHGLSNIKYSLGGLNTILIQTLGAGPGVTQTTDATGSGNGFNVIQPTIFEHLLISAGAR